MLGMTNASGSWKVCKCDWHDETQILTLCRHQYEPACRFGHLAPFENARNSTNCTSALLSVSFVDVRCRKRQMLTEVASFIKKSYTCNMGLKFGKLPRKLGELAALQYYHHPLATHTTGTEISITQEADVVKTVLST